MSNGWFCGSKAVVWVQAVSNVNARSARNALAKTLHIERGREGRSSLSPAITFSPNVALNTIEKLPPRLILWTSGQRKNAYAAFVVSSRQQRVGRVGVA